MSQPSRRRLRIETNGETGRVGDDQVSQWVNVYLHQITQVNISAFWLQLC